MTRTGKAKLLYVGSLVVVGAAFFGLWIAFDRSGWVLVVALPVLLAPGRIQGHYWRSFYRGRRLQAEQQGDKAIAEYQRFLDHVRQRPWIKRLMWVSGAIYTRDIEAMTHNNIGASLLHQRQLDDAERHLEQALAIDAHNPLPHYNLAVVSHLRGDRCDAQRRLAEAHRLGYDRTSIDQLIHKTGESYSRVEGSVPRAGSTDA